MINVRRFFFSLDKKKKKKNRALSFGIFWTIIVPDGYRRLFLMGKIEFHSFACFDDVRVHYVRI